MIRFLLLFCIVCASLSSYANDPFNQSPSTSSNTALFEQGEAFLKVEQAYQASVNSDEDGLSIDWQIAPGYYLYRDRFAVDLQRDGQAVNATVTFSPGKVKDDPYFGKTEVYYLGTSLRIDNLDSSAGLHLTLTSQGCADAGLCYPPRSQYFVSDDQGHFREVAALPTAQPSPSNTHRGLLLTLLLAAIGGAILNLMPCVFPVLGLKVLSFANAHRGSPASHGWVYSAGVVASFVVVAGMLIALQNAGQAIGWGFQLQSPLFVGLLASLFFVLSLNLLGLFELGGRWMNIGSNISREPGYRGSFFTGVLATLVASPCTAPFMGSAIGYAASQPPTIALLVFASLGAGMAAPVLLLTLFPRWLQWLPKPGPWMMQLRQVLAFPLLATAIWLAWVVGRQNGADAMAATLLGWLLLGLAIWLWPLGNKARVFAALIALSSPLVLYKALEGAPSPSVTTGFDRSQIQRLRESGRNVFLDVTADWCITCAANEALVLDTREIRDAFSRANVSYVVADWTRYDPEITALLADFQRNGIPLYIYYSSDLNQPPQLLPQILSKQSVLAVIGGQ